MSFSFSFPPEIEDEIFTWTARMPSRRTDASLPCVSKRVQACVEPILYETVASYDKPTIQLIGYRDREEIELALDSRPPSFFAAHVKNLCVDAFTSSAYVARVLSLCTGVQNLMFWSEFDVSPAINMRLRSLNASIDTICDLSKLQHTFPELVFLSAACQDDEEVMPSLEWLPALRRVRLEVGSFHDLVPETIKVVLQTTRSLQWIMVRVDYAYDDTDQWDSDRPHVEAWAEEDARIIIDDNSLDLYFAVNDWLASVTRYA